MEKEIEEKYLKAGKIATEVREESRNIVKVGKQLLEIAEEIEALVKLKGADPAFPVNISINEIAAHYTPTKIDSSIVNENDIIKIDIGVHIDGYVADTAITINFNKDYDDLVKAAEAALEEAVKIARPDILVSDISSVIEETIKGFGFKPVSNLTGHGISRYDLHAPPIIPNVSFKSDYRLKEDQVIAIEPFVTNGGGSVKDTEDVFIYSIIDKKPVRNQDARKIIGFVENRNGLPFAERWLPIDSLFKIRLALRELRERGILHDFHVLKEVKSGFVTQAEHSLIMRDPPVILA